MAKVDISKSGWTKIFDSFVTWPTEWEATNWAKNSNTLKKVDGADTLAAALAEGKKSHGKTPRDDTPNYNLFLKVPVLSGAGTILVFGLRSHALVSAEFDPKSETGVLVEEEAE